MNETNHRRWLLVRLKHSLQLLAIPADRQLVLLPDYVVKADELALDFTEWYDAAIANFQNTFSPNQLAALQAIDNFLTEMSEQSDERLWTDEALRYGKQWAQIRLLAKIALHEFGWEVEEPPSYQHEFVPLTRTYINTRVETVFRHIGRTYEIVPDEIVRSLTDKIKDDLYIAPRKALTKTINGADLSPQEIRDFLDRLPIDPNLVIQLIWPFDQFGISLPFHLFVENYDELWHPASDDVWITDQTMNWVLGVDHEENFTFSQF